MPPQNKTIQDVYKQFELDRLYAGKSSGDGESIVGAMQSQQRLASMPQGGAVESLTPIGPLDFLAETAMTGASQMENMNPLAMLLAGALAPGAYKKLKTTNTPALLKKFNVKVDNPLYHNTGIGHTENILKTGRVEGALGRESVSLTRNPEYSSIPGKTGGDLDVQIVLDKKGIKSQREAKIEPFVSAKGGWKPEYGSPTFGTSSPWFEAEERVFTQKGISSKNIKAIKIRNAEEGFKFGKGESLAKLLKSSANKKIPVIIEPAAEEGVMGLLDLMNPKQQSKVLKNTKFGGETVTLYRGVNKWHPSKMVKKGKFVGGAPLTKEHFDKINYNIAEGFIKQTPTKHLPYKKDAFGLWTTSKRLDAGGYRQWGSDIKGYKPITLEFEVPKSYLKKHSIQTEHSYPKNPTLGDVFLFTEGLPKQFLKKVHK